MQDAIDEGQAFGRTLPNGKQVIVWEEYKASKGTVTSFATDVKGKSKPLGDGDAKMFKEMLGKVDWYPVIGEKEVKAIEDRQELPPKVEEKISKAEKAFKKTIAEAQGLYKAIMKVQGSMAVTAREDLKTNTQSCREQLSVFEDMLQFHSGRDGANISFQAVLDELAKATGVLEKLLDAIMLAKGLKQD